MKIYQYSYTDGKVNPGTLKQTLQDSGILTALERIDTVGGTIKNGLVSGTFTCDVVFKVEPSQADKTTLDGGITQTEEDPPLAGSLLGDYVGSEDVQDATPVVIQEEDANSPTGGHYGAESIEFTAAANDITTHDITIPIDISLLAAKLDAKGKTSGDRIGFDVAPETTVGALAENVAAATTVIPVPASVIALLDAGTLYKGQTFLLDDGTNQDSCGCIISWDATHVTVSKPTTNAFVTNNLIKITTSMSPCILSDGWVALEPGDNKIYDFGEDKIGGSLIPKGKVIRIRYDNKGASAVVKVILDYLY